MLRHVEENGILFPGAGLSVMTITNLSQTLLNRWVVVKDRHFPYLDLQPITILKKTHFCLVTILGQRKNTESP